MADDATRKALALEYCRLLNAGDLEGVLALFDPRVTFEDPVGTPPRAGKEAVREYLAGVIDAGITEVPSEPRTSMEGQMVVLPVAGEMDAPPEVNAPPGARMRFRMVSLIRVGSAGLVTEVRVLVGRTDCQIVDSAGVPVG
ncbi:nuclear transport factor 2 family protein [Streptomyces profundus]|uniref:nuclear transport factor 2 family protein n=1 Tax=Streptomyces profundus TaxID=2867410 RepID=UPI001D166A7D|nr:nuclear transport factor 2 family protein [Streptomyces sp. MA3_2.13]UED87441.1 nuclear transport factor 2 family protein [Streptomyces sp. MA3_2.13]